MGIASQDTPRNTRAVPHLAPRSEPEPQGGLRLPSEAIRDARPISITGYAKMTAIPQTKPHPELRFMIIWSLCTNLW